MHPKITYRGIGIIRVFAPGQDHPQYGTAVYEMFVGTIHTQGQVKITRGDYTEM